MGDGWPRLPSRLWAALFGYRRGGGQRGGFLESDRGFWWADVRVLLRRGEDRLCVIAEKGLSLAGGERVILY